MKRSLLLLSLCGSFFLPQAQSLQAPVLVEPADNATGVFSTPILDWQPSLGGTVTGYDLEIDVDPNFSNPSISFIIGSSGIVENLMFNTTYYWRVRGKGPSGISPWSDTLSFTTYSSGFNLRVPLNGAVLDHVEAIIEWDVKEPLVAYHFQIDTSAGFNSPISATHSYISSSVTATFLRIIQSQLRFDAHYYWRIRAFHPNDMSDWSAVYEFTTPSVLSHAGVLDSATNIQPDSFLATVLMNGVGEYEFEIDNSLAFNSSSNEYNSEEMDTNSYSFSDLLFGETYYWRVRGKNLNDVSDWSAPWLFTIANTVTLLSPADSGAAPLQPVLKWKALKGVPNYQVEFDDNASFTSPTVINVEEGKSETTVPQPVEIGEYFWRVRGILASGRDTSDWSTAWLVNAQAVGIGEPGNVPSISVYPNPVNGVLNVNFSSLENRDITVTLTDMSGKQAAAYNITVGAAAQMRTFDVGHLSNGIYLLRLSGEDYQYNQKIIINK